MRSRVIINPRSGKPFADSNAYSGAGPGFAGQLRDWTPRARMADAALLPTLHQGNARADDLARNHGIASSGVQLHIDHIVGHLFRLSYKPRWRRLGIREEEARAFARDVEAVWMEIAEDPVGCWLDAERKRTFTMLIREGIGTHTRLGEIMATAEWIDDRPASAPLKTAIKVVSPYRVSNPPAISKRDSLREGVQVDRYGAATGYWVRNTSSTTSGFGSSGMDDKWVFVPRETEWGRPRFIHVFEPTDDGQTRGKNQFLAVMQQLKMLSKLQDTALQNAIVNAMYAAVIESELDSNAAMQVIGGEGGTQQLQSLLTLMLDYHDGADIRMDGVKIPHLVPGERLNLLTSKNSDNGFSDLERAFLRYTAAGLNVSYEQLSRDYSNASYTSAQAGKMETWRYMMGRRKVIASREAGMIFSLVLEELLQQRVLRLPRGARFDFYQAKAAWCAAEWIGSGRLAIDGLKDVKEAVMRIEAGLSTYEKEAALMGEDYQELFDQQVREASERKAAGLPPPSWAATQALAPDDAPDANQ
jgi:lambda family phage portal protein